MTTDSSGALIIPVLLYNYYFSFYLKIVAAENT